MICLYFFESIFMRSLYIYVFKEEFEFFIETEMDIINNSCNNNIIGINDYV